MASKDTGSFATTVAKLAATGVGVFLAIDPVTLPIGLAVLAGVAGVQFLGPESKK
jgi:hypothetical protein